MSRSRGFQAALVAWLKADAGVASLVADRVYDMPTSAPVYPHVAIGPSDTVPEDDELIDGVAETVQLDVWSRDQGRVGPCKAIVDAVYEALHEAPLDLPDPWALQEVRVVLARVMLDPDGVTAHGVVQVTGRIERRAA